MPAGILCNIFMEDIFVKKTMLFFVLAMVVVCSCFAQNTNAQKIVGTWTDQKGGVWIFNSDGTYNSKGEKYVVADSKLAILLTNGSLITYDISFSADGKSLILIGIRNDGMSHYSTYWCTKK